MEKEGNEDSINCVSEKKEHFLTRTPRWSLRAFAYFAAALMLLSIFQVGEAPPINIDVNQDLPWDHSYSPAPGGQWESIKLVNVTENMSLAIRFENVTVTSDLELYSSTVGTLESGVINTYIFQISNNTEPVLKFWATEDLRVKLWRLYSSKIDGESTSHIFGKTFYEHNGYHIIDITFSNQNAKEMTISSEGNITYIGITEFPASTASISRYGIIDNSMDTIKFPTGTKQLRLLSNESTDFDIDVSPVTFTGIGVIDIIGTSQNNGTTQFVRTITSVQEKYGVELTSSDLSDNISTGSSSTYIITVKNTGNAQDIVDLTLYGDVASASLSKSNVSLDPYEDKCVTLTVDSPSADEANIVTVKGISRENSAMDSSITTTTYGRNANYDFQLSGNDLSKTAYPDRSIIYNITISNYGNVEDTFELTTENIPENWTVEFDSNLITLDSNEDTVVHFTVTPPEYTVVDNYQINVNAFSHNNTNDSETITSVTAISTIMGVDISPDSQIKEAVIRDGEIFSTLRIQNTGTSQETFDVAITSGTGIIKDAIGESVSSVTLSPLESEEVFLHTFAPPFPNETVSVIVTITSQTDSTVFDSAVCSFTTENSGGGGTNESRAISIPQIIPGEAVCSVEQGEDVSIAFTIYNSGNQTEVVSFYNESQYQTVPSLSPDMDTFDKRNTSLWSSYAANTNWRIRIDDDQNESTPFNNISLGIDQSKSLFLNIRVPEDAELGEIAKITVKGNPSDNPMIFDNLSMFFQVTKLQTAEQGDGSLSESLLPSDLDESLFDLTNEQNVKNVQPGDTVQYSVMVQNNAQFSDTIDLSLSGVPDGWSTNLGTSSISLGPSESQEVIVEITPPSNSPDTGDADMDGLLDSDEFLYETGIFSPDNDHDLIWDNAERFFLSLYDLSFETIRTYLETGDNDNDGMTEGEEALEGTDPTDEDTDGDGLSDEDETNLYYRESRKVVKEDYITQSDSSNYEQSLAFYAYPPSELATPGFHIISFMHSGEYRIKFIVSSVITTDGYPSQGTPPAGGDDGWSPLNDIANEATTIKLDEDEIDYVTNAIITRTSRSGDPIKGASMHSPGPITWEESRYYNIYIGHQDPSQKRKVEFMVESPLEDGTTVDMVLEEIWVEKKGLNPNNPHSDSDGLEDGEEVKIGTFPLNPDSEGDKINDYDEVMIHNTNPHDSDSDDDGVSDFNEVHSEYHDDNRPSQIFKSDPNSADTDNDGLLDGQEDKNKNGKNQENPDDLLETNPCDWDTDNDQMPDGWEVYYELEPLIKLDRIADPDNDGLLNYQEYVIGTNASDPDSDGDGLLDGINFDVYPSGTYSDTIFPDAEIKFIDGWSYEHDPSDPKGTVTWYDPSEIGDGEILGIYFRTNVKKGAKYINHYGESTGQYILLKDYIVYQNLWDPNGDYWKFTYDGNGPQEDVDLSVNSEAYSKWDTNKLIITLYDLTKIYLNTTTDELYIWAPFSDEGDKDDNQILEGYYYVFGSGVKDTSVSTLLLPEIAYKEQELYEGGNPLYNDTDGDRVLDSDEARWDEDMSFDSDRIVNVRDTDSDDDTIDDGEERRGLSDYIYSDQYESDIKKDTYNADIDEDGYANMVDTDSDNDMVPDGLEPQWWGDSDNDGLDNMIDWDSDSDGIIDGFVDNIIPNSQWDPGEIGEDLNANGKVDPTETDPRKKDTDGDGLNDSEETVNIQSMYEAESIIVCYDPVQQVSNDPNASWGKAIINVTGISDVGRLLLNLPPGEYRFYVRARLARGATSGIMRLQVANTDIPYSEFSDLSSAYKWYHTDSFILDADTEVILKIFDKHETTPSIFIDKIWLANFPSYPDETYFIDGGGSSQTKTLVLLSSPDEQTVYVDVPYPGYYADTASLNIHATDEGISFPSYAYLDVGDTGDKQWYHPTEFYDTDPTETTPDFAHEINRYIYTHQDELDTTSNSIRVPLKFHSETAGRLHLSNLRITFKSFVSDPVDSDTDGDGLFDGDEVQAAELDGILNFYPTNPGLADTDDDLLTDKEEVVGWDIYVEDMDEPDIIHVNSNPLLLDTDGDGLYDFEEIANSVYYSREAELIPHLSFGPRNSQILNVGSGSTSDPEHNGVAVGDIDNDGDNDIVAITCDTDVYIKLWDGTNWVDDKISNYMTVSYTIGAVFIGDADNDSKSEIVTASPQGDCVYIYKWTGSTWKESKVSVGNNPVSVFVGDADNDGDNEIVTANYNVKDQGDTRLTVSATQTAWDDGQEATFKAALTADDEPITDGTNENTISILTWDDENEKWHVDSIYIGNGPHSVFIADADNDGYNDIVTANFAGHDISIVKWNSQTEKWEYSSTEYVGDAPYKVFVADIDYDGDNDIITANHKSNVVTVLRWDSDTGDWTSGEAPFSMPKGSRPYSLFVADADNDGYMDIMVTDSSDADIERAFWNEVEGQYEWTTKTYTASYAPYSIFIGDADNDGYNDLITLEDTGTDMSISIISMGQVVGDLYASNWKSIINKYQENEIYDTAVDVVGETHFKFMIRAKLASGATDGILDIEVMEVDDTLNPDPTLLTMTLDDLTSEYIWYTTPEFVISSATSEIRLFAEDNSPNAINTPGVYVDKIALIRIGDRTTAQKPSHTFSLDGLAPQYDYIDIPVIGDMKRMAAETSSLTVHKEKSVISYIYDDVCVNPVLPFLEVNPYYKQKKDFDTSEYLGRDLESIIIYTGPLTDVNTIIEILDLDSTSNFLTFDTEITTTSQDWVEIELPAPFTLSSQTRVTIEYQDSMENPVYPELYKYCVSDFNSGSGCSYGYRNPVGWEPLDMPPDYFTWLIGLNMETYVTDTVPIITDDGDPTTLYIRSPTELYSGQIKIFDTSKYIGVEIDSVSFYGQFVSVNPSICVEIDEKEVVQIDNPGFGSEGWHTITLPSPVVKNQETCVAIKYSADDISILKMFSANPIGSDIGDSFTIKYLDEIQQITGTWMMRLNMKVVTRVDVGDDGIYEWTYYGIDPVTTHLHNLNHEINKYLYRHEDDDRDGIINVPIKVFSNLPVTVAICSLTTDLHPYSTNPFALDTDKDFLYDADELLFDDVDRDQIDNPNHWYSIPSDSDSDSEQLIDGNELIGFDIDIRTSQGIVTASSCSDPMNTDSDNDQISDYIEYNRMNSNTDDADNDYVKETYEVRVEFRTNAIDGKYDKDGVLIAVDVDGDWVLDVFEFDPIASTTHGDVDSYTPQGYEVYIEDSGTRVVIDVPNSPVGFTVSGASFDTTRVPIISYGEKLQETYVYWTNPIDFDTDRDLLPDGWVEDYKVSDSEGSKSLLNGEDINGNGEIDFNAGIQIETDPRNIDSDTDGINDAIELWFNELYNVWYESPSTPDQSQSNSYVDSDADSLIGLDEYDSDNDDLIDPLDTDSDDDGLLDGEENWDFDDSLDALLFDGQSHYYYWFPYENPFFHRISETNPYNPDTDGDGLTDGLEVNIGTNPLDWDSDNDLLIDGYLGPDFDDDLGGEDKDNDGIVDSDAPIISDQETDPLVRDTDADGIIDGFEYYYMDDHWSPPLYSDTDGDEIINLLDRDSDNDGLYDGEENWNFDKFLNATLAVDNNYYYIESHPYNSDCDEDGLWDGAETFGFNNSDEISNDDYYINIWDQDSNDGDSEPGDPDYPPTENPFDTVTHVSDYLQTYVVFRTNAIDLDDDGKLDYYDPNNPDIWIAVDKTADLYYNENPTYPDPNNYKLDLSESSAAYIYKGYEILVSASPFYVYYSSTGPSLGQNEFANQIFTLDGYEVLQDDYDSDLAYVHPPGGLYYKFEKTNNVPSQPSGYADYEDDVHSVTSPYNFVMNHQETYDGRPARDIDEDGDGIPNWDEDIDGDNKIYGDWGADNVPDTYDAGEDDKILNYDEEWYETYWKDPDTDKDGILDGEEINWSIDTDGDGQDAVWEYNGDQYKARSKINALDEDSDNDGLKDGTEIGLTWDDLRADVRFNIEDLPNQDPNDKRIGNFVEDADSGETITDPLNDDTDGDGLYDGNPGGGSTYFEDRNNNGRFDGVSLTNNEESNPLNDDTDFDGLKDNVEASYNLCRWDKDSDDDGIEDGNVTEGLQNTDDTGDINALDTDSDDDGIWDGVELGLTTGIEDDPFPYRWYGTDTSIFRADVDPFTVTDPLSTDSDGDNIDDGMEDYTEGALNYDGQNGGTNYNGKYELIKVSSEEPTYTCESDPSKLDTDLDGINDNIEFVNQLWPNDQDSDDDGLADNDPIEGLQNTDGNSPYGDSLVNAADFDSDGDYLSDGLEIGLTEGIPDLAGVYYGTDLSIFERDIDSSTKTEPLNPDTDKDGIKDGIEDANRNGKFDVLHWDPRLDTFHETDPLNNDTDGDGINDGIEDANQDGQIEGDDGDFIYEYTTENERWKESDPRFIDTDWDGIPDNQEDVNLNGYRDAGETASYNPDTDNDGLWDGSKYNIYGFDGERNYGTDPLNADTDDDTLSDYDEVMGTYHHKSDPTSRDSDGDGLFDPEEVLDFSCQYPNTPCTNLLIWFFMVPFNGSYTITIDAKVNEEGIYRLAASVDLRPRLNALLFTELDDKSFDIGLNNTYLHVLVIYGPSEVTTTIDRVVITKQILDPKKMDTDGDGLSDGIEVFGWDICVIKNTLKLNYTAWFGDYNYTQTYEGEEFYETYWKEYDNSVYERDSRKHTIHVDSNPRKTHSYSPDLNDYQNFLNGTDPRRSDTDGDLILDVTEIENYDGMQYNPTAQEYEEPDIYNLQTDFWKDSDQHTWLEVTVQIDDAALRLYKVKIRVKSYHDGYVIDYEESDSRTWKNAAPGIFSKEFNLGSGIKSDLLSDDVYVTAMDYGGNINVSKVHFEGLLEKIFDFLENLWSSFVEALKAFLNALLNIWELIIKPIIRVVFEITLAPIIMAINGYRNGVKNAANEALNEYIQTMQSPGIITQETLKNLENALFPVFIAALIVITTVFCFAISIASAVLSGGLIKLIDFIIPLILTAIGITMAFAITWFLDDIANAFVSFFDTLTEEVLGFSVIDWLALGVSIITIVSSVYLSRLLSPMFGVSSTTVVALVFSIIGLIIVMGIGVSDTTKEDQFLGVLGLMFSVSAIFANIYDYCTCGSDKFISMVSGKNAALMGLTYMFSLIGMLLFGMNVVRVP